MRWFKKKYKEFNEDGALDDAAENEEFKQFHKTYRIISFAMVVGMIYPNPKTNFCRIVTIGVIVLSVTPISTLILLDMYQCWLRKDFIEIIRHSTVVGPFMGGFFKMLIMFYKKVECLQIIDEINTDYQRFNHLPLHHKQIIRASVQNNLTYSEMCWAFTVTTCVMIFPLMSTTLNVYNNLFKSIPTKYLVHELNIPFEDPETKFKSPYFEVMYVYQVYCTLLYVVNFLGFDGFFGVTINHACLKMELYSQRVEDAMRLKRKDDMYDRMVGVIKEQNKMFHFVGLIQETFNIWLGLILVATMIQICNCMYHIMEGHGLDLKYAIFICGTIVHIYLPCRYASKLKSMSIETADLFYSSGWENVYDQRIRKMLAFMIARALKPIEITAFNMLTFDMELFVSILQTSYSMFTLLKS